MNNTVQKLRDFPIIDVNIDLAKKSDI